MNWLSNLCQTHDLSVTVFTSQLSHAGKTILKRHWKNVVIESNPIFCRIIRYHRTVWLSVSKIHRYRYRNPQIYSPILHVNLIFLGKSFRKLSQKNAWLVFWIHLSAEDLTVFLKHFRFSVRGHTSFLEDKIRELNTVDSAIFKRESPHCLICQVQSEP